MQSVMVSHEQPHYMSATHIFLPIVPPTPDSKTVSSLTVKNKEKPLSCDKAEGISIKYTIAGEPQGFLDVMYLVSSAWNALTM